MTFSFLVHKDMLTRDLKVYFCSVSVSNRSWNGNPGFGTYLKNNVLGGFQARNGNNGPTFVQAPYGAEWYYVWNHRARLLQLVRELELARGNQAANINAALIQQVQNWGNNPPQWAQVPAYQGLLQFINQNRPLVTLAGNQQQGLAIKFVNEVAALIYFAAFVATD
jgi:hypothetical protein